MNRWLLLIVGMSLVFSSYGQKIKRIETKLIAPSEEGQDEVYSFIEFDKMGGVVKAHFPQVFPEYYARPDSLVEFLLLNLIDQEFDLSLYPVCFGSDWFDEFLQSTFSSCDQEDKCSAKLEFDGDTQAILLISKDIIADEIHDKFNPISEKAPTLYYDRYIILFDPVGKPEQIISEDWISQLKSGSTSHWFSYDESGLISEYINGGQDAILRYKLAFGYKYDNLTLIKRSLRNQRSNSWETQDSILLNWEGARSKSVVKLSDEGQQQYLQQFIYTYY